MKCIVIACLLGIIAPVALGKLIVGGQEATPHSLPYQVILFDWSDPWQAQFYCGGTLVHEKWVVSAAHCAGNNVYVGLGYHDRTDHSAAGQQYIKGTWHTHENYNAATYDNDIAMIELHTPANIGGNINTIGLSSTRPADGTQLRVSGWGVLHSGDWNFPKKLQQVTVSKTSDTECKGAYGSGITNNMFCANVKGGGKDACQNDSGGPIVSGFNTGNTQLEGVVSWGNGCASALFPGVYTDVSRFCAWIAKTTGSAVSCS